ncbi:MAG TPA: protein kinase [Candidatus Angelobacter sp.]|jgi:HD superfamily phosphohydrolase|nr:protein kinase [Candidatus Angelobacter sp.]
MSGEFSPLHQAPFGGEYYVFRDPVHNLIEIEDAEDGKYIREILRTPELQRLRRIRQNGLSSLVYPGIETTRFPHSLGSFHVARRIVSSLIGRQPRAEDGFPECLHLTHRDCLAFSVAALLHDIGHGPLSHVWEECWAIPRGFDQFHEHMGNRILADRDTAIGALLSQPMSHQQFRDIGSDVLRFFTGKHHLDFLMPLLEGNLDVDRLDFIGRDTRAAGVTYGAHDLEWIIRSLRFARLPARYLEASNPAWVIAIDGRKGLSTLVQFLYARESMYRLVYHHKTTLAATRMLALLFKRARLLATNNALSCHSEALRTAIALKPIEQISSKQFLKLDDSDIWSSIKSWSEDGSGDPILRDLASRLLSRDLFKVFLLSEDVYHRLREIDSVEYGQNLRTLVKARLSCSPDDAEYYYAFDSTEFDVIGRPQKKPYDVWIIDSAALGFEYRTLREYWQSEVRSPLSRSQYLLLVHPNVVNDLAGIVGRLSFRAESAKKLITLPEAPTPYRLVAPLGTEGAWKEVYAGANTSPGSAPEKIVALKRYKTVDGELAAVERDVSAINLLASPHENLSNPRLLRHKQGETWILEPLWTGSLEDLAKKDGPRRNILEIFDIASQLFSGLARLHWHKLRHTDIKPDNCGILASGSQARIYVLGDFGCLSSLPDKMPSDRRLLGTLRTRAPEVIEGKSISLKSDVWAMGATIYALCLMKYPFMPFNAPHHDSKDRADREREIVSNIQRLVEEHQKSVQTSLPPALSRLLEKCFYNEQDRLSAQEIMELFRDRYTEFAKQNDGLLKTAWQRAEDIVQQLSVEKQLMRAAGLNEDQRNEVRELLTKYQDFVPEHLRTSLADLQPEL